MSDVDALRQVAKSIAVHLEHLREYRGVHFVPAAPIPRELLEAPIAEAEAEELTEPAPAIVQMHDNEVRPPAVTRAPAQHQPSGDAQPRGHAADAAVPRTPSPAPSQPRDDRPARAPSPASPSRDARPAPRGHAADAREATPGRAAAGERRRSPAPPAFDRPRVAESAPRPAHEQPAQGTQPAPPDDVWPHDDPWASQGPQPARADRAPSQPRRQPPSRPAAARPAARPPEPATPPAIGRGHASGKPTAAKSGARAKASEWSAAKKLDYLRTRNIGDCTRCGLCRGRTNIVFGVGNPEAELMFVGEAPGFNEDRQGIPFVGRAGERLNVWLDMLGVPRDTAYIANVLKCRPPNNRDPLPEEVARCAPFLHAQIRAIQPKVLIALGRFAGNLLSGNRELPLFKMRGRVWGYEEKKHGTKLPVVVTYHPSYVLRQSGEQPPGRSDADAKVLVDLRQAVEILRAR